MTASQRYMGKTPLCRTGFASVELIATFQLFSDARLILLVAVAVLPFADRTFGDRKGLDRPGLRAAARRLMVKQDRAAHDGSARVEWLKSQAASDSTVSLYDGLTPERQARRLVCTRARQNAMAMDR